VVPLDALPSELRSKEAEPVPPRELAVTPAAPEEPSSFFRQALDVPLQITKGAVTGFRMLADAFGAGSGASEAIKSSEKYLEGLMSAQSRNDAAEVSRIMQDAENKGFGDQVRAAIKAFTIAPIDLISQALGTSAPIILGGLATTILRGGAFAASAVSTGLAGTQGAGLIKGNIYDAVKEEMLKAGDSPALAEEKAQQAQAYGGKNLDMILAGTALGALAGRTGVEKIILNKVVGKEAAEQGLLRRVGEGAVTEAVPEFVQAGQETLATNIALQREGIDVPTMRGVVGQATLEGLAGSALGATTGALSRPKIAADSAEGKAIAELDKLAADEEAIEARANEIIGEYEDSGQSITLEDALKRARFELIEDAEAAETSAGELVSEEDLSPEELKKIDKDLKKKLGRIPTTDEVERALNEFKQEKTRRLRAESGGRGAAVPVPSAEEVSAGVTGAPERIEPTGLDRDIGAAAGVGARKEPTLGALKPEDTAVFANIKQPTGSSSAGNVALQNYFNAYYGLPARSLPKAAGVLMPVLERAEALLQRYFQTYNQSNLPFLGTGPWEQGKRNANRPPEYVEAYRYMPSGDIRRLANAALAIDKKYKTKGNNPEKFASEIAEFEQKLNNFEEAINSLPPPLTNEERQAREAEYDAKNPTPDYDVVSKEQQLQALVRLLRKEPERLSRATNKQPVYTPSKQDPAKLQAAIDAGLTTQEELDSLQRMSDNYFATQQAAPTEPIGPTMASMQAELDALKAAGVEVPTFSPPSTAAEKREAKAKRERSKAIAKLAAELGGAADEEGGFRPARDEEDGVETPATDPIGFARLQAAMSFDNRNSSDYSDPEEAIDFGLDNLNDTLTEYKVTDPYIREQAVEAYKNEIARLKNEVAAPDKGKFRLSAPDIDEMVSKLDLKVTDMSPSVMKAIADNDLSGALTIASQKLTGFSADLAKALLELKLPTNISFNSGRDLVRRSIDNVSGPQQQRLFNYVQTHYPQVYDKYFKNYDRSESLENVAAGLIELQKPNYNLGPVIAEFGDVAGAYKKYIEGLTSPGAYYPEFDEIALDTNTLTGKSYRVFLHEVVHAATEHVLNTFGTRPQDLTPGQRAAAEELTNMYNYAVEKVGKTQYGMTNIYEFVAEVFTNKKFQDTLKGIKYEPKQQPFFTRFVRAILKAFGLDNIAGNAMAEATKIFSAVRVQSPIPRGPRFAKTGPKQARIRGPVSQTWRTAEDVTLGSIDRLNNAIKGRSSWGEVLKDISASMWDDKAGTFRRAVLGFANLRQIDDLTKTKFPQISAAIRMIEKMLAYRGNIMKSAEGIVTKWTAAKAKNPKQDRLMSRIMLEATIRGLDPDRPGTKQMNAALVQAWAQLNPEFKQIYREVRDFYATSVNNMVREMKLKVAKSTLTLSEKKAAIREINSKFGPDKLIQPYFPLRRFGTYWFQVGKGNFKEFYEFEDQFSREMAMRNRERELRAGNAQQQALADTIRKGNGLSELFSQNRTTSSVIQEVQTLVDSIGETQVAPTPEQYKRAEKLLQKQLGRTPTKEEVERKFERDTTKQELKDSLNQMLYILLPQQSMRKMFINRKAIQGASSDMLRVFATSAVHSAYQQSRFKFAEAFLNNLTTAVDYVEEFADRDQAAMYREYIAEVEKRASTILSNEDTSLAAKAAGKASELTFFYMLSAPFSAMLNLLGVGAITMPYIGGRYGYVKTNALMLKNFGRYLATTPSRTITPLTKGNIMQAQFPSIAEGGKLTGILKQAADRFIEEGQINISLTNDLMDMGDRPSELYTGRYNMVKKMLSGLFHQSERLGREVSLLTTFELAYDKFSKAPKKDLRGVIERDAQGNPIMNTPEEAFELAISEAKDIVGLSLGDFTRQMKPRYFTPPLLSVLTKFKQYSVLATYAVARNFYFTVAAPFRKKEIEEFRQQMLKAKMSPQVIEQKLAEAEAQRKELYREGRRRLAGILGVTYLLGGNEASPFYSIGLGTLIKLLANEDDDEFFDWENWLKNYMEEELGGAAGDAFAELGMNPETANKAGRFVGGAFQRGLVAEITGGELASRVSLDPKNLWYREGRYSPDVRESIVEDVIANAGPVVGLGFNWIDAYRLLQEGQYQRAFEKAAPALVSKPVAAARIAEEDARTAGGIRLMDNFSAWELAMLSIGLQPAKLAQAQKAAIEAKTYSEKVKDRRATLLDRLWLERDSEDGFSETLEKIREFSEKHPNHRIEPEDILDSFARRSDNQALAEAIGVQVDKKSIPEALQMLRYGRE
jgi:hypothetical protein